MSLDGIIANGTYAEDAASVEASFADGAEDTGQHPDVSLDETAFSETQNGVFGVAVLLCILLS
jgi:hypothetical protein